MKIKKLLLSLLILGTCMINSECMITQDDYLCAAEKYMEKKYGEEFEGKYFYDVNYDSMYVVPKSNPDWYVTVVYEKPDFWNVKFHDNYVAFLVREEVENIIKIAVEPIYSEYKIFSDPLGFYLPDNWNRDTQFEEYREQRIFSLYIYVSDSPANREFDLEKLKEKLYSLKLNFSRVNIIYVSEEQLNNLDNEKADRIFSSEEYFWRVFAGWDVTDENGEETVYWYQGNKEK